MRRRRRDEDEAGRATLAPGMLAVPNVTLTRKIAEGGMGSVWEGEHLALRTTVAVKFVLAELGENEEAVARFEREATSAARIKSPHVVQVLDHGLTENEGVPYIVMELLEGEDLEARLHREPQLPLELVAHIVQQASKALTRAHSLGIVHRDIKPSNVYLTDVGGETFVKLLDFGIAKLMMHDVGRARVTQTGAMLGTPIFMSPEQMTHAKDVGPGADLWSLGVVAYLALLGRLPFDEETIAGIAMAIERGVFPAPTSLMPDLPAAIDDWFSKIFKKDPNARFASAKDMAEGLARIAQMPISPASVAHTSTPPPPGSEDATGSVEDEPTHVEDAGKIEQKLAEAFGMEPELATEVRSIDAAKRAAPRPSVAKPKATPTPVSRERTASEAKTNAAAKRPTESTPSLPAASNVETASTEGSSVPSKTSDGPIGRTQSISRPTSNPPEKASGARPLATSSPPPPSSSTSTPPPPIFDQPASRSESDPPPKGPSTVMGVSGADADLPTGRRSRSALVVGGFVALAAVGGIVYAVSYMNGGGGSVAPLASAAIEAPTVDTVTTGAVPASSLPSASAPALPAVSASAMPTASASAATSAHPAPVHAATQPAHSASSGTGAVAPPSQSGVAPATSKAIPAESATPKAPAPKPPLTNDASKP